MPPLKASATARRESRRSDCARRRAGRPAWSRCRAVAAGTWPRLKACREPSCRWAFYDHSRNHGRTWCSMNVCGNRVKVRASQRRRASSPHR
ncbi:CGNR zinc finger domain-containing protein [Nocardia sp. NPDC051321]|uniref:CGNR zinc finger domain-containing protein n=1 Tax=Nocardia sp. NPDC051321 TaxID=3364323 RepID=UPI0037B0556C